jgi:mono/diheme cytochrome c family protein
MANDKPFSLFIDAKSGVARGASNADFIVLAQGDLTVGKDVLDIKEFTFMPPAGAKKEEKPTADSVTYAQVETILKANCLPCHSAGNRKAGLSVDSYEGVMAKVVAGNAANSGLFRSISGPRASMPQGRAPLSKADLDTIETWINAGAKNP